MPIKYGIADYLNTNGEKMLYKEDHYEIIEYIQDLNYHTIKISHQYDYQSLFITEEKKTKKNNVKKAKIILPLFE